VMDFGVGLNKRQVAYVQLNTDAPSRSHCCSAEEISIIYSECVFVTLGIQHAMRLCIVISVLPDTTVFFHIIS